MHILYELVGKFSYPRLSDACFFWFVVVVSSLPYGIKCYAAMRASPCLYILQYYQSHCTTADKGLTECVTVYTWYILRVVWWLWVCRPMKYCCRCGCGCRAAADVLQLRFAASCDVVTVCCCCRASPAATVLLCCHARSPLHVYYNKLIIVLRRIQGCVYFGRAVLL